MPKTSKTKTTKPLREPISTEIKWQDIELRLKIGKDVYVVDLNVWKEVENNGAS